MYGARTITVVGVMSLTAIDAAMPERFGSWQSICRPVATGGWSAHDLRKSFVSL